uniref:Homeobox domain-containing protein n=1 Tax=Peromyscus maniculatus bairdii TaxID=230844 RepID=A0A8C8W2U3_PERMB
LLTYNQNHISKLMSPIPQMAQDSARKSSLPMSQSPLFPPRTLMQSNLQWHSDPERSLGRQEYPGPPRKPSLPRHPGPPTLGTQSVHPSHQMPSSSPVSSGCESSLGPMVCSEKHGAQQVCRKGPRKQRKERTVYSHEQKLLLLDHFDQFKYPDLEQRVKLALLIGVTENEVKIWFKNQRARWKREELKNVKEALPESTGSSQDDSVSTHSPGQLSVTANVGSLSPGTSTVGSIPNLKPSMEASLNNDQAVEDSRCSSQEDLLDGKCPAAPPNFGKPTVVEVQTDPAVTDGPASVEAAVSTRASPRSPDVVQYLHPSSEQLWKLIYEDLRQGECSET